MNRRPPKFTLFPYTTLFRSHIEVTPQAVCSKKRDVRSVAHAVVGIAENALPGRFRPSLASAAHDVGGRRCPRGASAGAAAASRSEEHTSELQSRQYLVCRLL